MLLLINIHISQNSSLLPEIISHEALVHPMLFLGATKFGPSFAGALLTKTLKYIKETHGAVVLSNIWKHPDHSFEFFDTGLTLNNQNTISLIIHFADLMSVMMLFTGSAAAQLVWHLVLQGRGETN